MEIECEHNAIKYGIFVNRKTPYKLKNIAFAKQIGKIYGLVFIVIVTSWAKNEVPQNSNVKKMLEPKFVFAQGGTRACT